MWHVADRIDDSLTNSAALYENEALHQYLQGIMDELYPEFAGRIRVRVLKSPIMNAFCSANGSVYLHSVILASADNEAQLAAILAHEGAHFTQRHAYRSRRSSQPLVAARLVSKATGITMADELAGVSSMTGYSRDLEREADAAALTRLVAAGYDPAEAAAPYHRMLAWVDARGVEKGPYFLSSRAALEDRIASFESLALDVVDGQGTTRNEQIYDEQLSDVLVLALDWLLDRARYEGIILALEDEHTRLRYPGHALYSLGEAYRLRGQRADEARSVAAYKSALEHSPDFALTYRALGRYHHEHGNLEQARRLLQRYLVLASNADDAEQVQRLIERMERDGDTQ